jgi:integrase
LFARLLKYSVDSCQQVWQILDMQAHAKDGNGSKPGPKGKGLFRIVEFTNPSGNVAFRVTGWTLDGQRIRQNFSEHGEAVAKLQELEIQSANLESAARPVVTRLTPEQAAEAEAAFKALEGKFPDCPPARLGEAVRYYLDNYREPVRKITVEDAFKLFIQECEARNLRPLTITNLKGKTKELRDTYGKRNVSEIGADTLRELIFKPTRGAKARDNYRRVSHGFFEWARRERYCATNPAAAIAPIKADRGEPAVLTPEQASELLEAARTHKEGELVPYVALALFAGLRPTELARLEWHRINLKGKAITIGSDIAKMRSKRIVEMSDNLREWLAPYAVTQAPIVGSNFRRDFDAVKAIAGWGGASRKPETVKETKRKFKPDTLHNRELKAAEKAKAQTELKPWTQDVMRHSAISYHLARYQHEGKTATWAGNSPDMVQRHYKGLVTKPEARRFWKLSPPSNRKPGQPKTAKAV